jgi:UDP-glucose:tetrahydrobiopterin glucosyltransferase
MTSLRLLFLHTPVGPFGSGMGGGVELSVSNIAKELLRRSHTVHLVAPHGSYSEDIAIINISGELHSSAQYHKRDTPIVLSHQSVLANMWEYACTVQHNYDLLVNFAYDWLPFYLTPFLHKPVAHLISMGSLLDSIDAMVAQIDRAYPGTIGFHTRIQADTFGFSMGRNNNFRILSNGIDMDLYTFNAHPDCDLAWVARVAPEKGLEDAAAVSEQTGLEVRVLGKMQDEAYWQKVQQNYPRAKLTYLGFQPTHKLQEILGNCQALLMTPKWIEAFGNVAIEAMACGVPVLSYARGGPIEIITHGKTGWLVEPDNIDALCRAVETLPNISRAVCRSTAKSNYSLQKLGDRFESWFYDILRHKSV